jgi:hypothetical protein
LELLDGYYIPKHSDDTECEEKPEWVDPRSLTLPYIKAIPVNKLPDTHPAIKFLHKDELWDLDTYANLHKIVYVPYEGGMNLYNGSKYITSAERLVFPVYFEQELVGWQMRSVPGTFYGDLATDVRYYHLFHKGSYLYNYDQARQYNRIVVVEGVKKALKFPNGVATWGSCLSKKQLRLIQTWKEVVMLLDSDKHTNTQEKAKKFVDGINSNPQCKAVNVDLAKYNASSPDELPSSVLQLIIDEEWQLHNQTTR